ncbi:phosphatase PAP2 family protein [Paenibacillus sp. J2TS4]|uniref:phosphatase PAP2 family protein n=1 Tax=Paenibacillus sp. J2TS4 TaxID=2807194 RepID=UPI001B207566|nr:phosphatase PAP2 family protein [Paenibacillus sp. J2TS4]GIP31395.1 hypothetical protein J2TS4_06050 [Paenibacillus sp. J2TS4]
MFSFHTMTEVTIWTGITVIVLLLATTQSNPIPVAGSFIQQLFTSRRIFLHLAAVLAILLVNRMELWLEEIIPAQPDFTPAIYQLEGDLVASIQHFFEHPALTSLSTFFYVVVFQAVMIVSIALYIYQKQYKLFYAVCYALIINYVVAIPFYLFFPVFEAWSFHPDVRLLILDSFPTFEQTYRSLSGLDNCFPSLHTSLSVTMAVIALKSGNRFWGWFASLTAAFIIFSIFYMGIHWVTDAVAGSVLGVSASLIALRISQGRASSPVRTFVRPWKGSSLGE